ARTQAYTHTRIPTHTFPQTHTRTHTSMKNEFIFKTKNKLLQHALTSSNTFACMHTRGWRQTHSYSHTYTYTLTLTHVDERMCFHSLAVTPDRVHRDGTPVSFHRKLTHTHTHIHTHTHTHTLIPTQSIFLSH